MMWDAEYTRELLCDLIALPTINPMGRLADCAAPVERPVIEYLEHLLRGSGAELRRQACSPLHESLLITIPGEIQQDGTLFESHIDTVPAADWSDRAFTPRVSEGRIFGRGACDDKASLAAMILALLELLNSGRRPPQTVWLLAAGDEEYGQTGIQHFLSHNKLSIGRAVFGEPTNLVPIIQHKGTIRWEITVRGRSCHSSQPELGRSAILEMFKVISALTEHERQLRDRFKSAFMSGPSITVTTIEGGQARNMVPDCCKIAVDFRILPGMDGRQSVALLFAELNALGLPLEHGAFQCFAPALNTSLHDPFVHDALDACQHQLARSLVPTGVPYGSDAGWFSSGPAIVLGPGDIAQAHAIDEYVELSQVVSGAAIYHRLMAHNWLDGSSPCFTRSTLQAAR